MMSKHGLHAINGAQARFIFIHWLVRHAAWYSHTLSVYQALQRGEELGPVMDKLFDTVNIKQKGGAIGLLTLNHASRQSVYEVALTLAMAKFHFPDLYTD